LKCIRITTMFIMMKLKSSFTSICTWKHPLIYDYGARCFHMQAFNSIHDDDTQLDISLPWCTDFFWSVPWFTPGES
jgi:hypothetical protein